MKKFLSMVIMLVMVVSIGACGSSEKETVNKDGEKTYVVGISQFAEHPSLDNCRDGFIEGLKEQGLESGKNLTIKFQNSQADTGTAATIADSFVASNVDMINAIATPSAMSAYNSCLNTEIPVVYTAVSDPVSAGIADKEGKNIGNITGSSDVLPVEQQLKMIRELMPEAKKIGIIYTTSEANSCSTIETYKELAPKFDFEIVDVGISLVSDVDMAASELVTKVDCISNLTDNTVVSALQTVLDKANTAKIPVFGSEIEQVKAGCVASMGIDYFELGKQTGVLAAKILRNEITAKDTDYITASSAQLYINVASAEKIDMKISEEKINSAKEIFNEIKVQ